MVKVVDDQPLEGFDRVYVDDPFGNRIELMEPLTDGKSSLRTDPRDEASIALGRISTPAKQRNQAVNRHKA